MNQTRSHSISKKLLALILAMIMVLSLMPMTVFAQEGDDVSAQAAETPYRIVHLDCGRKYFSVENIKKLIDTMAQYGYNQLQLAFGNGGCRFLLDDMNLSFDGVEMASGTVKDNITKGNNAFNGDTRYLGQDDMDAIIAYANGKGIEIVPMLNMPGHATAIVYGTNYSDSGNLNVSSETARNYGYALLAKYAAYFAGKNCRFFHFGSDESGYTGPNMTAFLKGCAKVITDAGMTPRAFNDATNVADMPANVQITYWHQENGSKTASALANAGYGMINTHGRWYYVIKNAQNSEIGTKYWQGIVNTTAVSVELPVMKAEKMDSKWVGINEYFDGNPGYGSTVFGSLGTMFCIWCDASQDAYLTDSDVISENENYGALYQIEKLAEHYWPEDIKKDTGDTAPVVTLENGTSVPTTLAKDGILTLKADQEVTWKTSVPAVIDLLNPANSETITGTTVTAVAVGKGEATITAEVAGGSKTEFTITVYDAADGKTVRVELNVGESQTFDVGTANAGDYITGNNAYIATATVAEGQAQAAGYQKVTSITSGKKYLITNYRNDTLLTNTAGWYTSNYRRYAALTLNGSPSATSTQWWMFTGTASANNTTYTGTLQHSSGAYLNIAAYTASASNTPATLTLTYNANNACWTIAQGTSYLNQLGGGTSTVAGGYTEGVSDEGSRWYVYEITEATSGENILTITGVGESTTSVTVGDTTYNITVTAPETKEAKALSYGKSFTLPTGAEVTEIKGDCVTSADGKVTAGQTDGTATVTAVVKNEGGYVTQKFVYNVKVSKVDLSGVSPLSVELWVTNRYAGGTHNGTTYPATAAGHIVSVSAAAAYGEDGISLEQLVPTTGADEGSLPLLYWKGTRLSSTNKQTYTGTDMTGGGSDFQKIRYYNDSWQYYFKDTWTTVLSTDQIIAYYMQVYNTSPEIVTAFRDYGGIAGDGGGEYDANWFDGYRGVGTAVVYSDKSMSPDGDTGIWNNTLICYYESASGGGNPGLIKVFDTEDFKITKITITKGVHQDSTGATGANATKTWNRTTSSVLWNKTINDAGDEWYDETEIWTAEGHNAGETITLDDSIWGDTWKTSGIGEAFLLLFYVEPVEKEDNLTVLYWDDSADARINPNDIKISVKDGVTFINGIKQTSPVSVGTFTLDDNATIENSVGVSRGFNKNITILEGVAANYRSGIYEYVGAEISEDGKTLTLHYDLKKVDSVHEFVVDFGLPVKFTDLLSWFNVTDVSTVEYLSVAKTNKLTESTGSWGSIKIDETNWDSMTYTLDKMLGATATIPLYCKLITGVQTETQIRVIPASTVYYEDSFVTFNNGAGAAAGAIWAADTKKGSAENATPNQLLEQLGSKQNPYGYDAAYNNCTTFSMGSAQKVTVTKEMNDNFNKVANSKAPTATFTFKGTGFDIISLTDNTSGAIVVNVEGMDAATASYNKNFLVNNYYGYTYNEKTGWETTDSHNPNALYQIPVMKVNGLGYGTYQVTITVGYSDFFDKTGDKQYSFWLDAIRVYDPLGKDYSDYTKDSEGYPQYIKLHDELVKETATATPNQNLLFIDGAANATVELYKNYGPNNEVYLAKGQAISFVLNCEVGTIATVQIGAKAPMAGTKPNMTVTLGQDTVPTKPLSTTATEMYYMLSVNEGQPVTIANNGTGILSLTNLKITYTAEGGKVTLGAMTDAQQNDAVMAVRSLFTTPVEPEPTPDPDPEPETFEPGRFEASWGRSVRAGQKATLTVKTSEDVESITVNGENVNTYRTRTERSGWGWWAKKVTYREFTYTVTAAATADYTVIARNGDGAVSQPITATLTVRGGSSWWGSIFDRWF